MSSFWKSTLGLLVLIAITVWIAVAAYPETKLHLIACDVGQGDAILAVYGKTQILVDGGPGKKVLDCLSRHMPFWDREIELVVITHPQIDHFGGIVEVLKRYRVDYLLASPIDSSSQSYQVLKDQVGGSGVKVLNPSTDMVIRLGLIYLDIVHPSKQFISDNTVAKNKKVLGSHTSNRDPNDFSIVANLRLKDFDALLTGDSGPEVVGEVLAKGLLRDVEYIKIPHHGSKNGLTKELLEEASPEVAVISVGRNNRYGHPHEEVLSMLSDKEVKIFRTDEAGDIEIVSNGQSWWIAK